jgi:hypothetical protein
LLTGLSLKQDDDKPAADDVAAFTIRRTLDNH